MGKNVATGIAAGQASTAESPEQQVVRVSAERAVAGAVESLDDPAQREKLQQLVSALVTEAISSAFRAATSGPAGQAGEGFAPSPIEALIGNAARAGIETTLQGLVADLGENGEGPLAASLASTGRNVSAAAVGGAVDRLSESFPGCRGPDALACIDRQVSQMSRSAGAGFATGIRESIGWPLLVLAGLLGLGAGILGSWIWSLRSTPRLLRTRTT
jgi:hypothetical protein